MSASASDLYRRGELAAAIAAVGEEVKRRPTDGDRRALLVDFLCSAGQLERADKQLEVLATQVPEAAPTVALARQVLRAESWRREVFAQGRVPEFLGAPSEHLRASLQALVHLREGERGRAAEAAARAEEARPRRAGRADELAFDDLRDADDLCAGLLEVLTSTGKYYWVPLDRVVALELRPIERPRDLVWRRALLEVAEGPEGEVWIPMTYAPLAGEELEEALLLGRATDWVEEAPGLVRGRGLRTFLAGEEARTLGELGRVTFTAPAPEA